MMEHRLTRYGLAGGLSLLTHLTVLIVLVELAGAPPVLASTLGFIASFLVSFALQHRWVFEHENPVLHTLPRFVLVTLIGLGLNALVMALGHSVLDINYLLTQAVAFVMIPVSNYLLNRRWTFNTPAASADPRADRSRVNVPTPDRWILLALMLAFTALGFAAVLHLDLARDLATAFDMRTGSEWIWSGPQLAGVFNLGPIWYYLLAVLQSIGLGVAGIAFTLTVMASFQFLLAYRAGACWMNRRTGLLWAIVLLVPGWHSLEQIFITHPVLTTLLLAASTLFGLQFAQSGRRAALGLMSLSFSLALHAHPSSLMIVALPAGLYVLGVIRHGFRPGDLLLAIVAGLLPFLPFLLDQQQQGWPMIGGLEEFQSGQAGSLTLAHFLSIGQALFGGGLHYLLSAIIGLPSWASAGLTLVAVILALAGLCGSLIPVIRGDRIGLILWLALLSGWLGLTTLRVVHPYYMLTPLSFVLAALIASGLNHWIETAGITRTRKPALLLLGAVLLLQMGLAGAAIRVQQAGQWPFSFYPFMDIKQPAGRHQAHSFMSALNSRQSGRWLCRNPGLSVHGPFALTLIHGYAMDAQLHCGQADIIAGGSDPARPGVVGLPRGMVPSELATPIARVGPFDVFNRRSTPRRQRAIDLASFRTYPPFNPAFEPEQREQVVLDAPAGPALVVTHLGFALSRRPAVELQCGAEKVPVLAEDHTSWLFDLADCPAAAVLSIEVSDPDHVDVVVF